MYIHHAIVRPALQVFLDLQQRMLVDLDLRKPAVSRGR